MTTHKRNILQVYHEVNEGRQLAVLTVSANQQALRARYDESTYLALDFEGTVVDSDKIKHRLVRRLDDGNRKYVVVDTLAEILKEGRELESRAEEVAA